MEKNMLTLFSFEKRKLQQKALIRFLHRFLHKSILGFEKWTKKMSKIENPKYFCVKSDAFFGFLQSIFFIDDNLVSHIANDFIDTRIVVWCYCSGYLVCYSHV